MTLRTQHEKPVYVRLRETIADAILAGQYGDGDPLPSVRAFAAEQGISRSGFLARAAQHEIERSNAA